MSSTFTAAPAKPIWVTLAAIAPAVALAGDFDVVRPHERDGFALGVPLPPGMAGLPAVEQIVIAEEAEDERVGRMLVDLLGRIILLDVARVHHRNAVGDFERLFLIVGDENCRDLDRIMQFAQPAAQFPPHGGIERAEWLVQQQHLRLDGERAGERDALALAAGQLRGIALGEIAELDEPQQLIDLALDRGIRGRWRHGFERRPKAIFSKTLICLNSA